MADTSIVKEWFTFSENDLISAKHLFNDLWPKQIYVSTYLCQQCAEKALKGYLIYKENDHPHTHDLLELCKRCAKHEADFSSIIDNCVVLTPYSAGARYPDEMLINDTLASQALNYAEIIYKFCKNKIAELDANGETTENA